MKKAKEYAQQFIDGVPYENNEAINKAIHDILVSFMKEVEELCRVRHSNSDRAVSGAIKEQHRKWQSFARKTNEMLGLLIIREDGFKDYILHIMPEYKNSLSF